MGESRPRPFLFHESVDLLYGGKHFFNLWGLQLLERFRFDLPNSLPCHREALPHLL